MIEASHIGSSVVHDAFLHERGLERLDPATAPTLEAITHLSFQFPGEHCTECAAPDCHESCDLFRRGPTGRCLRFEDGIVVRPEHGGELPYSIEIIFKLWGQVICVGNVWCVDKRWYRRLAVSIPWMGRLSYLLQTAFRPLSARMQWRITDWIRGAGNRVPRLMNRLAWREGGHAPDRLLCVVGNPQAEAIQLELSVSGFGDSQGGRSFRQAEELRSGWNVISIPIEAMARVINLKSLFRVCIVPLIEKPVLLQFLYIGFAKGRGQMSGVRGQGAEGVRQAEAASPRAAKVKLLVVDLDNTLWDGILIENPDKKYSLRPGCREALEILDQRGILLSIASKNNTEDAFRILDRIGIRHLFLYPQINWEPKSAGIRRIVQSLNIGMDTVAFIDDSGFERAEVKAALPEVLVWDAPELLKLSTMEAFDGPVTEESKGRRVLYQQEQARQAEFQQSSVEYESVLAACRIILKLEPLSEATLDRVSELVQRTNQLNFSGTRYVRADLERLLSAEAILAVVMRCEDRFGSYGIVGFSILKRTGDTLEMSDLMLSCRIQGKKVEHAYLIFLIEQAHAAGLKALICCYNRTARNAPAGKVFEDLQFQRKIVTGSREVYCCHCGTPSDRLFPVTIEDQVGMLERLESSSGSKKLAL